MNIGVLGTGVVGETIATDTFGWQPENLFDLGGIVAARGTEAYVPFWVMIMQANGSPMFNGKVVK
jgi:hypothetical protein